MSKNVKLNNQNYSGVSTVQIPTTDGGTASFKDVDEIIVPSGAKTITTNGTHDVSTYAQAVVNVPTGGNTPVMQEKSVTITENGTTKITPDTGKDGMSAVNVTVNVQASGGEEKTDYFEFRGGMASKNDKTVKLIQHGKNIPVSARSSAYDLYWCNVEITVDDELQQIDTNGLYNMGVDVYTLTLISNNNFANLTTLQANALRSSGITEVNFPEVTTLAGSAGLWFGDCKKLTSITLPKVTKWSNGMTNAATNALSTVQIGSIGYGVTGVPSGGDFGASANVTETIYTTSEYVDTIVSAMRSVNATATIVIMASETTTYNGQTYSAGDTILTDTGE